MHTFIVSLIRVFAAIIILFVCGAGFVETYAIIHGTLWWVLNICAIFWKVQFPFHSRYYDKTNQTIYIHIGCVIIAIVLPLFSAFAVLLKGGFTIPRFPPVACVGRDVDVNFYTVVGPTTLLFALGTTVLLLIFWRIRRVCLILY